MTWHHSCHAHMGEGSSRDNILCLGVNVGSMDEYLDLLGNDHLHVNMVVHWRKAMNDGCALYGVSTLYIE